MARLVVLIVAGLFVFASVVALGALLAFPVMWLWGYLFTGPASILGTPLPALDFWHAWALLILSGLLFKSSGWRPVSHRADAQGTPWVLWERPLRRVSR